MSTNIKNLSEYNANAIPDSKGIRIGIAVSEWNHEITETLFKGAHEILIKHGVLESDIKRIDVPGSFELPTGAVFLAENTNVDAVICLGCVIQGETKHFDFICDAVAHGLVNLTLQYKKPFIFGVLTPNTLEQAWDRTGGKHGNKGDEAAITALKMVHLQKSFIPGL